VVVDVDGNIVIVCVVASTYLFNASS
jgi:hypothetical protein